MGTKKRQPSLVQDQPQQSTGTNVAVVTGEIIAEPQIRTLPSGSVAVSMSLTVRAPGRKTTSVPIVWYDPPKRVGTWTIGDQVSVRGSVVRRFFRSASGLGSSTEVVVEAGHLARHQVKQAKVIEQAVAQLKPDAAG